ncbi:glycosyltransferase [uncultured Methanobrevibacter sp.]|uniref:glycosyltransferase n=1 Tax=uncultured Methanobrevibacter sp. TaxID=253161 RepID=UPI00342D0ECD
MKKDNRIKIINNKINLGLGTSRNIGLDIVKGEYISFVDCDDWIKKEPMKYHTVKL